MKKTIFYMGLMTFVMFTHCKKQKGSIAIHPEKIETILPNMSVPSNTKKKKKRWAKDVVKGWQIVKGFAKRYKWQKYTKHSFFDKVELYQTQKELWQRILELHNLPKNKKLPTKGLVAALEKRVLLAVLPETYKKLQPAHGGAKGAYPRLLAHEMAHRLHVAILHGKENQMGPQWFFEGFAVVVSGDMQGPELQKSQLWKATKSKGDGSYRKFAQALRFLMKRIPLPQLVQQAGKPGFEQWLKKRLLSQKDPQKSTGAKVVK